MSLIGPFCMRAEKLLQLDPLSHHCRLERMNGPEGALFFAKFVVDL